MMRESLKPHRWHPYSILPKKLKETDLTRDDKMKERDKDEWRVTEDVYFSSTKEMVRKEVRQSFIPKMTLGVWNDKKVKNKEMLVQGLANKLLEDIRCDNNNK